MFDNFDWNLVKWIFLGIFSVTVIATVIILRFEFKQKKER
jgi:hypothetical protein